MLVELDKGPVSDSMALLGMKLLEVRAVEEMGDPVSVGTELDRIHRPKPQLGLLALTMLLALTGAVPRVALTAGWGAYAKDIDPKKTALAVVLGCGALLLGYFLDYARLGRWGRVLYVGALAAWNDWQEKIKNPQTIESQWFTDWSECRDSNSGPLEPHSSAIPNFATPGCRLRTRCPGDSFILAQPGG